MSGKKKIIAPSGSSRPQETEPDKTSQRIKAAFERGEIKDFDDIYVYLKATPFAERIEMQKSQLDTKLEDLQKFNFGDILQISRAFDVDFDIVLKFIANLVKARFLPSAYKNKST